MLCTTDKTFPIRSVQTSNSLFVVQPAVGHNGEEDAISSSGIKAIASCSVTLELSKSAESALPYLRNLLPVYSSRDLDASAAVKGTFINVCSNVPLSGGEVKEAWTALCAFEEQDAAFRPSASVLLELWKAIVVATVAEDFELASSFLIEDLWISMREEEYPRGMLDAVFRRINLSVYKTSSTTETL